MSEDSLIYSHHDIKRIIFTGTPGSGKSTVINLLEKMEHVVIHEAATDIISQGRSHGIDRPWEEPEFVDLIVSMQKER